MAIVYLNGEFLSADKAQVSVYDRGYLLGDGVYEVIPVYAGNAFLLDRHLQRLQNSLDGVRIENPFSGKQWTDIVNELIARNNAGNQSLYLQVTRGVAPRDHIFPIGVAPSVFMMSNPLHPVAESWKTEGIKAITTADIRWMRCDIKAITLLANSLMKQLAQDAGAQEALLIRDNYLTEGSASNAYAVIDGVIFTAPKDEKVLPGITRDLLIELAAKADIPLHERAISESALRNADEIWISSSTKEVVPVTLLDGEIVGSGKPGPVWQQMDALFQQYKNEVA
ncbi:MULTISPECIES: D-amino-acid transaminase [unclassified Methylophaga]|uniref:D-amino-acid transaminase n=1 Tax=unclassified Methylophaga TaxID=2629249 RepID=UPI000C98555F|nr:MULTISPECIES: D-amino-acid transaminase [unclassified Methylophaga]MAK66410.1 D-amino-acid transaminase [Methylophaga sp.]MAY17104.1 D-amino-acid transaminase [Methylophaga sp.]HAO26449.1 D-amino-acid transaminase [Methylophaga sp.]